MLCDGASEWGNGPVGIYGDNSGSGLCSDGAEYTFAIVGAIIFTAGLCIADLRRFALPWLLFAYSTLNLIYGQIVVRGDNLRPVALLLNSRQITMPLVVYTLCFVYLCITRMDALCIRLMVRLLSALYTAMVSYAAARYDLHADATLFEAIDGFGMALSLVYAATSSSAASS